MKYILFLAAFLTGCAAPGSKGLDGYYFQKKEYENLAPQVEFVLLRNQQEYERRLRQEFGVRWDKISAFSYWNPEIGKCTIFIKDPDWDYEPHMIGHEVAHCIWGEWHE